MAANTMTQSRGLNAKHYGVGHLEIGRRRAAANWRNKRLSPIENLRFLSLGTCLLIDGAKLGATAMPSESSFGCTCTWPGASFGEPPRATPIRRDASALSRRARGLPASRPSAEQWPPGEKVRAGCEFVRRAREQNLIARKAKRRRRRKLIAARQQLATQTSCRADRRQVAPRTVRP